jgi:streptomycin 6-kinase
MCLLNGDVIECVPNEDAAIDVYPSADEWAAAAQELVGTMLQRWDLRPGDPFSGGASGVALAVTQSDGSPAVLKVAFPHPEGTWEAVGLQSLTLCAPAVLRQDPWTWSLLLERVEPGTPLQVAPVPSLEALEIGGRLHLTMAAAPPDGIPRLGGAMQNFATQALARLDAQLPWLQQHGAADLVPSALAELARLAADDAGNSLLHGDFNPGNILDAGNGRWMTVDPKPLVGDRAFDLWPLISQIGSPFNSADGSPDTSGLERQLVVAATAAETDVERTARWAYARAALSVGWFLEAGFEERAAEEADALKGWAAITAL